MSHSVLTNILKQLDNLSLDEKKVLSSHLVSSNEENQEIITHTRLKAIQSQQSEIIQIASNYGASNIRYLVEEKEVIFIVDLDKNRSLLDLGGLLESLRYLLSFDVVVFVETMIKESYREEILSNALQL